MKRRLLLLAVVLVAGCGASGSGERTASPSPRATSATVLSAADVDFGPNVPKACRKVIRAALASPRVPLAQKRALVRRGRFDCGSERIRFGDDERTSGGGFTIKYYSADDGCDGLPKRVRRECVKVFGTPTP